MEHALMAIDGDAGVHSLTPKPGVAETEIVFIYKLPSLTTFSEFAVPNILETPSPPQTFIRKIEISGSDAGAEGPYQSLATATLTTHPTRGQSTTFGAAAARKVGWVRVTLTGGIDVQRERTFFEFSEIVGYGAQEPVPMSDNFSGKWRGRGVLLELRQEGALVTGCYDGEGDLRGDVSGNLLRATGRSRNGGIPSVFLLAVGDSGEITGVRSTNGAPFNIYIGPSTPTTRTECSERPVQPLGCGSVIHGINFDFDAATIRPGSDKLLDVLADGLKATAAAMIAVVGHTSSEGTDAYNEDLSRRRAAAVVAAMTTRGIAAARISAEGRGEAQPIADNATETGRSLNRRVEIACR
jgi:outer membrane protein OmpA-like peptidoglycan-associated protein